MDLVFKRLKFADAEAIAHFASQNLPVSYSIGFFLQFVYNRDCLCLYVTTKQDPDTVLGTIAGQVGSDGRAQVHVLAVAPTARRNGLGTILMKEFTSTIEDEGIKAIEIQTRCQDAGAIAFYQRLGFEMGDIAWGAYGALGDGLRMCKPLSLVS